MKPLLKPLIVLLALSLVAFLPAPADAQCATCRRALQSPEGQQMIAAFRSSILFLLMAPLAVFGTVATLAIRAQRRRFSGAGDIAHKAGGN